MTPLELDILLHYYSHANDWRDGDFTAPVCDETFNKFMLQGLLTRNIGDPNSGAEPNPQYRPTDRLNAFVHLLCKTPLPVQVWCHPDEVIRDGPTTVLKRGRSANASYPAQGWIIADCGEFWDKTKEGVSPS